MPRRRPAESSTDQLIESLRTGRVNTLTELCRIERIAAAASDSDAARFQAPMTAAWTAYVTSHNLLNELRGLTRNYPFSSACLDEGKRLVLNDPLSNRSWNYAWLVLNKIDEEGLIKSFAHEEAARPEMWGATVPEKVEIEQLAACFAWEWEEALERMLGHWSSPPSTTGY